jgi:acyl-CoA synthetase (AMP-forming)/AMP-acid ligase II
MKSVINIAKTFENAAKDNFDRIAVKEAATGRQITFGVLNTRADGYAGYLAAKGVKAADITMLMVTPSIDFICLTLAAFKLGTPVVLIDPGMGFKNLLKCVERVGPKYMIGVPKAVLFSKLFSRQFRSLQGTFCCGKSLGLLGPDITTIPNQHAEKFPVYKPGKDDLAAIIFTTGSTGPPKGVRYEHSIFSAQLELIRNYYKIGSGDVDQPGFPLFALFSAALGACSIIPDMNPTKPAHVDPEKFVKSILENNVSYSFGSPAIWNVVSSFCISKNIVLGSVKTVLMAGAPVPYDLMRRVKKILPQDAKVHTPYGATESLPIVSIEGEEIIKETFAKSRVGGGTCVGRPLPGIEIKIIELSDTVIGEFSEVTFSPVNKIGEIIVTGNVVTRGYMGNPTETKLSKIYDGDLYWHRMGDLGYLDSEGRLWFCGRKAHRVDTGRQRYYSVPCEAIVNEHPNVYRSALVGVKDYERETCPVLVIEPVKGAPAGKELLYEVQELASKSTLTRDVTRFLIHKNFPVDIRHNAKIFREKLALWAQKKLYPSR